MPGIVLSGGFVGRQRFVPTIPTIPQRQWCQHSAVRQTHAREKKQQRYFPGRPWVAVSTVPVKTSSQKEIIPIVSSNNKVLPCPSSVYPDQFPPALELCNRDQHSAPHDVTVAVRDVALLHCSPLIYRQHLAPRDNTSYAGNMHQHYSI